MKWVGLHEGFDLGGDVIALVAKGQQLPSQFRQHDPCRAGAHDHNGLFSEGSEDCVREAFGGAGCALLQPCLDMSAAGSPQCSRCGITGEQVSYGRVIEMRAQCPLEGWWIWVSSPRIGWRLR
ncbi:hypothetical protein ABIA70_000454 [Arthrobacter sp. 754]